MKRWHFRTVVVGLVLLAILALGQESLSIKDKEELPAASMWEAYSYGMQASGGIAPYHWFLNSSSLPKTIQFRESGELAGTPEDAGSFEFEVRLRDSNNPPQQLQRKFKLTIETPLKAEWDQPAKVNGQRIDGSVKVSNRTGRDFDLTFVVLAVNDIGRATAIGYQRFQLTRDTRAMSIPFGDTLAPANYAVNVDVVAEEPISNRIFRARLVTAKQAVTQGP